MLSTFMLSITTFEQLCSLNPTQAIFYGYIFDLYTVTIIELYKFGAIVFRRAHLVPWVNLRHSVSCKVPAFKRL